MGEKLVAEVLKERGRFVVMPVINNLLATYLFIFFSYVPFYNYS